MRRLKILITGANGYLSRQLLPALSSRFELVLLDVTGASEGQFGRVHAVDLSSTDLDSIRPHFRGVDVVIHNAYHWREDLPTAVSDHWQSELPRLSVEGYFVERTNLDMAFNVLRMALEEGVRRVVLTSSNHATDWYEILIHGGHKTHVETTELPLSDNFYGWSKSAYELLGFVFASGRLGRKLEIVSIRVGAPREIEGNKLRGDLKKYRRDLGAYISQRDLQQLYIRAVEAPELDNGGGAPFQIVYGISNNSRAFLSLTSAQAALGYKPVDDSELRYSKDIAQIGLDKPPHRAGKP